ncbi:MAG: hypothetical protein ACI4V1_01995 [Eubacteriales bacterium]
MERGPVCSKDRIIPGRNDEARRYGNRRRKVGRIRNEIENFKKDKLILDIYVIDSVGKCSSTADDEETRAFEELDPF